MRAGASSSCGATSMSCCRRSTRRRHSTSGSEGPTRRGRGHPARRRRTVRRMPAAPLSHLRVLDLTDLRGALAGRLLADLGADVVKLEPPGGDADRLRAPFAGGVAARDRSLAFLYRHANKRGATLDLDTAEGRGRLDELCEATDVLIENLDLGRRKQLALEPEEVNRRHPHLVHVAIADFGLSGPRAGWRLEALPAFAASGALYASGFPELAPCWLPGYAAHDGASIFAAC